MTNLKLVTAGSSKESLEEPTKSEFESTVFELEKLSFKELIGKFAKELWGCDARWYAYYNDYCCYCENHYHCCDSQCSILRTPSWGELNLMLEESGSIFRTMGNQNDNRQAVIKLLAYHSLGKW